MLKPALARGLMTAVFVLPAGGGESAPRLLPRLKRGWDVFLRGGVASVALLMVTEGFLRPPLKSKQFAACIRCDGVMAGPCSTFVIVM